MASSISPSLQSAARSAYRHVLRSTRTVFKGDAPALAVAHSKLRSAYEENRNETDAVQYEQRINTAREVADLLLKHVVQGEQKEPEGPFKLNILPTTELGDNATIRKQRPASTVNTPFPNRGKVSACGGNADA